MFENSKESYIFLIWNVILAAGLYIPIQVWFIIKKATCWKDRGSLPTLRGYLVFTY